MDGNIKLIIMKTIKSIKEYYSNINEKSFKFWTFMFILMLHYHIYKLNNNITTLRNEDNFIYNDLIYLHESDTKIADHVITLVGIIKDQKSKINSLKANYENDKRTE